MKVIGLCGGSGSGKGTVSKLFAEYGILSVDTDKIYHEITSRRSECLDELVREFGDNIIGADGALDRAVLRRIVFADGAEALLGRLNKISHFHVLAETRRRIDGYRAAGVPAVLIDAPLLFESGFDKECDGVLAVLADRQLRIERIIARDSISLKDAEHRIASQLDDVALADRADYIIRNDGTLDLLKAQVARIAGKILYP